MNGQTQRLSSASEPLLAHLAARFVSQRENLATEALAYILSRSENARSAITRTLRLIGADIPDGLTFRTQAAADDQAIPDLVGEDAARKQRLIVEAKFWAGLTSAQPVKYLERIKSQGGGTLVFVVPALRMEPVWQELQRRCQEAGWGLREITPTGGRYAELEALAGGLAIVAWRELLTNILSAVEQAGEQTIASDIRQLQGLCDREDSEAFLPLQSEELTNGSFPRRLNQFCELIDDLTVRLTASGIADTSGLRATAGKGTYGRYLRIHGIPGLILFSAQLWASKHPTPIWLRVFGPDWKPDAKILERLSHVALPETLLIFQSAEGTNLPVVLPSGVERDQVLKQAEGQLLQHAELLKTLVPVTSDSVALLPPSDHDQS